MYSMRLTVAVDPLIDRIGLFLHKNCLHCRLSHDGCINV